MRLLASQAGLVLLALLLAVPSGRAEQDKQPQPTDAGSKEDLAFFEKEVRPLLTTHCLRCHGPEKQRGQLRLDSRAALLKGGDLGPAVNLQKPDESILLTALDYQG